MSAWAKQLEGSKKSQKSRRLAQLRKDDKPAPVTPVAPKPAAKGRKKASGTATSSKAKTKRG